MINAFYGTDNYKIDVTNIIKDKCICNDYIIINSSYNELFGDICPHIIKTLYINLQNIDEVKINENTFLKINLKPKEFDNINIVYFINTLCNENYYYLMSSQLKELKESNLLSKCKLYIEVNTLDSEKIKREIYDIIPNAIINTHINCKYYEYHGINKVWELSQDNSNNITLYFHSKGISRIPLITEDNCRLDNEKYLFNSVINNWQKNILILSYFENINKLGSVHSNIGFIWYNFWWVKGSYVKLCEKPIKTERRHYYEDWLCRKLKNNLNELNCSLDKNLNEYDINYLDCYSLDKNENNYINKTNIGSFFIP